MQSFDTENVLFVFQILAMKYQDIWPLLVEKTASYFDTP